MCSWMLDKIQWKKKELKWKIQYFHFQKEIQLHIADAPRVTKDEYQTLMQEIPNWQLFSVDSVDRLKRTFKFENYSQAIEFSNKVGELAEREDHHPSILIEWGQVEINWWTHKIGGLHKNDFISAAKTDLIFDS